MSMRGRSSEIKVMRDLLRKYPTGPIACVSDTYDIYQACMDLWGTELRNDVMSRDGTLVVRPDSGDVLQISMDVVEMLLTKFPYTINSKGYKVLDSHVRMIQGDGVDFDKISAILGAFKHKKISADNIAFGMGGMLLQGFNRDTQKFAYKCCAACLDGSWHDVYKDPVTAPWKASKRGRMRLIKDNGTFKTVSIDHPGDDVLQTVFENGEIKIQTTLDEIRGRLGTL